MWTGSDHDDDRIDNTIDEVARRMTEGGPSGDLKARVLSRIEEPNAAWWRWRLVWIAAPLAAAAIIFLIVIARPGRGTHTAGPQPSVARGLDQPLQPTPRQQTTQALNQAETSRPGTAASVARTSAAIPPRSLHTPSAVEELAPPQLAVSSIAVPSMAMSDIATTSIAVERLETIVPIALSPIGEGDRQ